MSTSTARVAIARTLLAATLLTAMACTPLQVLTHSVSRNEASVPVGRYDLDLEHCSITFDVEHLKYSRFTMRFDRKTGQLDWNEGGLERSSASVTIDAASIDTNVPLLDKMVKSSSMLDVERYPQILFVSTKFERTGESRGTLTGNLTIHGVTQPVSLDVTFNGFGADPLSKKNTLGFSAEGHFSLAKFGLATWYPAVGDDIHVRIQAEFGRTPAGA
ncbi:YceI family protein [Paraburkholderia sp. MPAMCS5]|uniref:YceI family protein n=1 Tax=Paraburkholderia sp. MPAMCS5 TaxID=3112563 RepID=UPI002E182D74|nr:YceI family protein [Paraburkholderia sp. MPAMCS5]